MKNLLVILAILFTLNLTAQEMSVDNLIKEAKKETKSGDYATSFILLDAAAQIEPSNTDVAYLKLANSFFSIEWRQKAASSMEVLAAISSMNNGLKIVPEKRDNILYFKYFLNFYLIDNVNTRKDLSKDQIKETVSYLTSNAEGIKNAFPNNVDKVDNILKSLKDNNYAEMW